MRIRTGLRPEDWIDQGPSTPLPPKGYSGGLVVSDPGWRAKVRQAKRTNTVSAIAARLAAGEPPPEPKPRANRARVYATDAERLEARRRSYRESRARARERRKAA